MVHKSNLPKIASIWSNWTFPNTVRLKICSIYGNRPGNDQKVRCSGRISNRCGAKSSKVSRKWRADGYAVSVNQRWACDVKRVHSFIMAFPGSPASCDQLTHTCLPSLADKGARFHRNPRPRHASLLHYSPSPECPCRSRGKW